MNTTDWLSNWTYPDFPIPENEAARIKRIAELSLEQFPKSEILEKVCELAALNNPISDGRGDNNFQ